MARYRSVYLIVFFVEEAIICILIHYLGRTEVSRKLLRRFFCHLFSSPARRGLVLIGVRTRWAPQTWFLCELEPAIEILL